MVGLGLGQRLGGRREGGGFEHGEDLVLAQPDVTDQPLEPHPSRRLRARAAQILIDDHHPGDWSTQLDRTFGQLVLALQALGVLTNLHHRGLAHIHVGVPAKMPGRNFRPPQSSGWLLADDQLSGDQPSQQHQQLLTGGRRSVDHRWAPPPGPDRRPRTAVQAWLC